VGLYGKEKSIFCNFGNCSNILNELWQIIGVMNNIDNGTGKKESRLKIQRVDSLGAYAWDSSNSGINNGNGVIKKKTKHVIFLLIKRKHVVLKLLG